MENLVNNRSSMSVNVTVLVRKYIRLLYLNNKCLLAGRVSPNHAHSMVEFYYYTGACNSSQKNLDQIRHNFIQALSSSLYKAVCNNDPACKAEYVSVTCGPTTRRRRDITNKERRSTHPFVYTVAVDITVPLTVPAGQPLSAALATKANLLIAIGYKMQEEIRSGHFDLGLPDMQIRADDFYQGMVEFKCPNGMVSRMSTSSCGK